MKNLFPKIAMITCCALVSCTPKYIIPGTYQGYPFKYTDNSNNQLDTTLMLGTATKNLFFSDSDKDGRFDEIELNNIPKGDALEKLASFEVGQEIVSSLPIPTTPQE